MAMNLEKIRKMAKADAAEVAEREAKKKNSGSKTLYWKPKPGVSNLRIAPPWATEGINEGMPLREIFQHWNIGESGYEKGGRIFLCPAKTEGSDTTECEVCDLITHLWSTDNPADQEIAKEIKAGRSFASNIIDLDDPSYTEEDLAEWEEGSNGDDTCGFNVGDTKVQVYTYGVTVWRALNDYLTDGIDLTDLADPTMEIKLSKSGSGYDTTYQLRLQPKGEVFNFVGSFEDLVFDLDNTFRFPRDGEMRAILAGEEFNKKKELSPGSHGEEDDEDSIPAVAVALLSNPAGEPEEDEDEEEEDGPPPCFEDKKTFSMSNKDCAGDDEYEQCEFTEQCKAALVPLRKARKRKAKKAAKKTSGTPTVADVEAEMRAAIGG
ncbi:MAG: hypothetical protein L3J47_00280 [Sulfurovum sp.]|nr:hypothetical protein [Sulfurovum sp.]